MPRFQERLRRDLALDAEAGQLADVDDLVLDAEDVGEAALVRHPAIDRVLTALEADAHAAASARVLALHAATRGLDVSRAMPAPNALAILNAPFGERRSSSCIVNRPSCRDCDSLPS